MASNKGYAGVFVTEKTSKKTVSQQGVVGAGAFIGITPKGKKDTPILVESYEDFTEKTGGKIKDNSLAYSVLAFFKEGGGRAYIINPKMDDTNAEESDKDQISNGVIFMPRTRIATTVAGVANFNKAQVLYNSMSSLIDTHLDYSGTNKVIGGVNINDIDLASFRVKHNNVVVGMSDSSGVIHPVGSITGVSGDIIQIKSSTSLIDLTPKKVTENIVSIELEVVGSTATPSVSPATQYDLEIEYVLKTIDINFMDMTSSAVVSSAGPDLITVTLDTSSDYDTLTTSDFNLESLSITDGAQNCFYNPITMQLEDGVNTIGVSISSYDAITGILVLACDADPTANFSFAGTPVAVIKADVTSQDGFYKDHTVAIDCAGNSFYLISSLNEANAYNDYFIRMSMDKTYLDSNYNTIYVDADVYENQYSDTGELVSPVLVKDIIKMSFDSTADDYFFTLFNDDKLGSDSLSVDDNSVTADVPLQMKTKPNADDTNGYHYGNMMVANMGELFPSTQDVMGIDSVEIIKGSIVLRKGAMTASNTVIDTGVATTLYQDNGIGGFVEMTTLTDLPNVSINYETGVITGLNLAFPAVAGNSEFIDIAYATIPVITEQDFSLDYGVGGTEVQSALLSAAVTTDSTLETQGRGIYAINKIQGEYIAWGIPHLASNYAIALSCMKFCDNQDVKNFNYVWNISDEYTEEQVGGLIESTYTYRTKNAFVTYPYLEVEDVESSVIRSGSKKTVTIPYVGTLIGKIANRIGSANPSESIAGKESGKINWGVGPTRDISPKMTELLTDLVIPAVNNYDTGFVFWGDGSLADRNYDFETVSDTLIFGIVQYDIQSLLWSFEFKVVNDDLLRRVHSTVSRYLLSKTQLGWFGTTVVKDAFEVSMAKNNESTRTARQMFVDLMIALPYTLKQTYMQIERKH